MRIGSLFSGAGGLDLAVESVFGADVAWHCEIDPAASKVLEKRWPGVPNLGDVSAINWHNWKPVLEVDILCGGFPCQDVSSAGKRAGIKDGTRSGLWTVFADAIDALRPPIVVIENVKGLLSARAHRSVEPANPIVGDGSNGPILRAAGAVFGDLADLRYDAIWATVAAADVGAPHRRERVFIVAHASGVAVGESAGSSSTQETRAQESDRFTDHRGERTDGDRRATTGLKLFPTPNAQDGNGGGRYSSDGHQSTPPGEVRLLPTPRTSDTNGAGQHGNGGLDLRTTISLLPTPRAASSQGSATTPKERRAKGQSVSLSEVTGDRAQWGKYEPAIRRWESLTSPAPAPTEPNKNGNPRLSAAFSEWLMGWPQGWVTDPAIGISRNDQLRIIGNGVCPQQAIHALTWLIHIAKAAA